MVLTLIGYRGTGKSSVAPALAAKIGWDCVDADAEIEREAGITIREIFDRGGEVEFRRIERRVMKALLQRDRLVLAAGGGAVLDERTRNEMKLAGPVVWLQASAETIVERLLSDPITGQRRPSLTGHSSEDEIRHLLAQRTPIYRDSSTLTVTTEGKPIEQIAEEIAAHTASRLNGSPHDSL